MKRVKIQGYYFNVSLAFFLQYNSSSLQLTGNGLVSVYHTLRSDSEIRLDMKAMIHSCTLAGCRHFFFFFQFQTTFLSLLPLMCPCVSDDSSLYVSTQSNIIMALESWVCMTFFTNSLLTFSCPLFSAGQV